MPYHLAQLNIGRLVAPLGHPEVAEFESALDAMNLLAEASPGFVWRLVADDGRSSSFVPIGNDPRKAVNLSVWESIEALKHYTYRSGHRVYLQRRRDWFAPHEGPHLVCWWIPAGTLPTVEQAMERLDRLANEGPGPEAFTLARPLDPPTA